jgi:membrane protease YdiL (CAAX protease family)
MKTGFLHIDGNAALGRAPAVPRHWIVAALTLIVAQWIVWQGYDLGQAIAFWSSQAGLMGIVDPAGIPYVISNLFGLLVPTGVVAVLALYCSRRFDGRTAKAIGLDGATTPLALVWTLAGVVAAASAIITVFMAQPDLLEFVGGLLVLTPITIVQAGAEEILFRGVILGFLSARYGARTGVLISALLFGLWHVQFSQLPFDMGVAFLSTFVFGVTAAVLTLHYANLGPALALHVVWNLAWYMSAAALHSDMDFWSAWVVALQAPWTVDDVANGRLFRTLISPLLFETFIIAAACRETVQRILDRAQATSTGAREPSGPNE